jgi:aspartate/methionine/tyrosine aminotransferase
MKIEEFKLERWLLKSCEIDVAGGGVTKLKLKDIVTNIHYDQLLNYGATNGSEILRNRIADWYPGVKSENVLVTSGTTEANLLINLHLLEPGDEYVAIYPVYEQTTGFVKSLGCQVKPFFIEKSKNWQPDIEGLKKRITRNTRILFFDNPNNPTGACISEQDMQVICEIAEAAGAYVVCDNALRGSELDGIPAATPLEYYDKGIVTGSLSKLGMTGPRIGWLIGNENIVNACWKFKDYTTLSHSGIGEYLATIALEKDNRERTVKRNLEISKENLSILSDWIGENSDIFDWIPPQAGFTVFLKFNAPLDSVEFCSKLLHEENVLVSPGEYFGLDGHFRLNFGCRKAVMIEVLSRIKAYVNRLRQ